MTLEQYLEKEAVDIKKYPAGVVPAETRANEFVKEKGDTYAISKEKMLTNLTGKNRAESIAINAKAVEGTRLARAKYPKNTVYDLPVNPSIFDITKGNKYLNTKDLNNFYLKTLGFDGLTFDYPYPNEKYKTSVYIKDIAKHKDMNKRDFKKMIRSAQHEGAHIDTISAFHQNEKKTPTFLTYGNNKIHQNFTKAYKEDKSRGALANRMRPYLTTPTETSTRLAALKRFLIAKGIDPFTSDREKQRKIVHDLHKKYKDTPELWDTINSQFLPRDLNAYKTHASFTDLKKDLIESYKETLSEVTDPAQRKKISLKYHERLMNIIKTEKAREYRKQWFTRMGVSKNNSNNKRRPPYV